jgi:uncharacterized membrane protein
MHDKALHTVHAAGNGVRVVARDILHRVRGFFFETQGRMRREEVDDRTIEARVRSSLGRVCSHPHAIRVHVEIGRVRLEGDILKAEHSKVISRIARVRGVLDMLDNLQVHKQAGHYPELQGGRVRKGDRPEFLQHNWSPAARFLGGICGGSLLTWGLWRRDVLGGASAFLGTLLTLRSITNLELKRLTGVGAGRQAIALQKDILVHAPVEVVFGFWRAMENFPLFMSHVEEVRTHGEERSHWRVKGPAGITFEWDALITRLVPNQVLAWKSVEGSTVENAGIIRFEPANGGRSTRLDIRLSYNPPAGALGHGFARLLGVDPKKQMDDDLLRFKSLLETGKATGHETVSREQLPRVTPEHSGPRSVH